MTSHLQNPLKSTDTLTIARALSDKQIEIIRNDPRMGDGEIANRLQKLRNAAWGEGKQRHRPSPADTQLFNDVMQGLDKEQTALLISSYARMGHLYEIAAITARDNYFKAIKKDPSTAKNIPGSIDELIKKHPTLSVNNLVEKLNQPEFEVVMTMHPTNVNSLRSMKAQREIAKALDNDNEEALLAAITHYQNTPVLHQNEKKEDANLTVRDETNTVLYFLGNIYEDLPRVYTQFDTALEKQAKNSQASYDRSALKLGARFGSWGSSGDKDGNSNVNCETTLEAIALHTQAIIQRYHDELKTINSPALNTWQTQFDSILKELAPVVENISDLRKNSENARNHSDPNITPEMLDKRFDALSDKLAKLRTPLNAKAFESALEQAYKDADNNPDILNLLRRFRTFGFSFSKIEYRETAEEYSRVVAKLIPGYKELEPKERVAKLTEILTNTNPISNQPATFFETLRTSIVKHGATKPYAPDSEDPITYHTLKRMALARDFPDMIKDNVLAECGKLDAKDPSEEAITNKGVSNLLEAQFLQRAVEKSEEGKLKRPLMGIVPLFEEPDTMKHIDKIMGAAYKNPAYEEHMKLLQAELQKADPKAPRIQQVQIAHSDNARRSGLPAARSFIHDAHEKIRKLNKENSIKTQFFEGGSMSDPYRNGVRAVSSIVNDFDLHNFAKFTFQGGDLLNYFNDPRSCERLFSRNLAHQAEYFAPQEMPHKKNSQKLDPVAETIARKALQMTLVDYEQHDFKTESMGLLLALLGYKNEIKDGNKGSRAGKRQSSNSMATTNNLEPIDIISGVRTIGFSEALQHNGLIPTWIGAGKLERHLAMAINTLQEKPNKTAEEANFLQKLGDVPKAPDTSDRVTLEPTQLHYFYEHAPTFKDSQDRAAFGHAQSDMTMFNKIVNKKIDEADTTLEELKKLGATLYLEMLEANYRTTARTAYAARTGKELDTKDMSAIAHTMAKEALPNIYPDWLNKGGYRNFLLDLKLGNIDLDNHARGIAHMAGDTVMHGRWIGAEDPAYTKALHQHQRQH